MTTFPKMRLPISVLFCIILAGCAGASRTSQSRTSPAPVPQGVNRGPEPYIQADVHFMQGMIVHHNQAVKIARWAPTHGASPALQRMAERVVVAQTDENRIMAGWLIEHNLAVPDSNATHHTMPGMDHPMLMPGMLTEDQLLRLDAARGVEFDRLFLSYMIQHHQGAIVMVEELQQAGGAQGVLLYKITSDVYADQTTEIHFMTNMLNALPPGGRNP